MDGGEFIKWYFDTHYIVSTFFTPFFSFMWGCFTDNVGRSLVSFVWLVISFYLEYKAVTG